MRTPLKLSSISSCKARINLVATLTLSAFCCTTLAQPTDNPVTKFYPGLGQYDWTDQLAWSNVMTTSATPDDGLDDLATVEAEIATLSGQGGGVLYFPAGVYNFSDDLTLMDGVVLRGVQPGDGYVADNLDPNREPENPVAEVDNAKSSLFALDTHFEFPPFVLDKASPMDPNDAFKMITTENTLTDSNIGVVWIDINRARVQFMDYGDDPVTGLATSYWAYFGVPWDPGLPFTDPSNSFLTMRNRNIVVFGNRSNNATDWDNRSGVSPPNGSQDAWQIWPKRFAANIDVFAYENVIVANNQCNYQHFTDWDNSAPNGQQPGPSIDTFLMTDYKDNNGTVINSGDGVWFRYTSGYGIKLNRSVGLDGSDIPYTPEDFPMLYRKGMTVRDNWVFLTVRVGYFIGGAGLEMIGNYRQDVPLTDDRKIMWVDPTGRKLQTNNSATYENRGYDVTGTDVIIHKNQWDVQRGLIRGGPYLTIDGEGILHQEVGGGSIIDNWTITDNVGDAYIGLYKARDMRDVVITGNDLDDGNIYVQADTNGGSYSLENVLIENNASIGVRVIGTDGISNVIVNNNDLRGGSVNISADVVFTNNVNAGATNIVPNDPFDAVPEVSVTSPADGSTAAPGDTVTLTIEASDSGAAPVCLEVWNNFGKLGDATPTGNPDEYAYDLTVGPDEGLYYYWVKACGTPHDWYALVCVRASTGGPAPLVVPTLYISYDDIDGEVDLSFDTEGGLTYEVFSNSTLIMTGSTLRDTVAGDGSTATLSYPLSAGSREFFYVEVSN